MSNFYYFPYFETICEYRERLKIESEVFSSRRRRDKTGAYFGRSLTF